MKSGTSQSAAAPGVGRRRPLPIGLFSATLVLLGLVCALIGTALSRDVFSLRRVLAERSLWPAFRLTNAAHNALGQEGAHRVEQALSQGGRVLLGLATLLVLISFERWRRASGRGLGWLVGFGLAIAVAGGLYVWTWPVVRPLIADLVRGRDRSVSLRVPGPVAPNPAAPTPRSAATPPAVPIAAPAASPAALHSLNLALAGDNSLSPGTLALTATFNSIGIELFFIGDANGDATAGLEFKRSDEAQWRRGLPLWRTDDGSAAPGPAFYGSALLLEAGTTYDLRVTLGDPDGINGNNTLLGTVTTRAEDVAPPGALVPTHFVRSDGNDAADGASEATAWRTVEQAFMQAPAGAVVQVGPGYYNPPAIARRTPLTLLAQYPAVDDARGPINEGLRSVVEPSVVLAPAGSGERNAGLWQQVGLVGPSGATFNVWRYRSNNQLDGAQLGYAPTRSGLPRRLVRWKAAGPDLATPEGWAEKLWTNRSYNYGYYVAGLDLYLRLPGDLDPNTLYITTSGRADGRAGLAVNGPNVRVSGFEVREFPAGIQFESGATFGIVDHCLLAGNFHGVTFRADQGPPSVYGSDHLIQYNRFVDTLWSDDPTQATVPWTFIKGGIANADGQTYTGGGRIGDQSETSAVSGRGGARRVVVRFNTVDGTFNGFAPGYQQGFDRYAGIDMDVHDNLVAHVSDDGLEPEGPAINFRAWNNRFEYTATVLSTGPVNYGPVYFFRNEAWRTGAAGVGRDGLGETRVGPVFFKRSGRGNPPPRVFVVNNTLWTDQPNVSGGDQYAGSGSTPERFFVRNNIIRATRYAFAPAGGAAGLWDEDYDYFYTDDPTGRGLSYSNRNFPDMAGYRAASGQGGHSNLSGDLRKVAPRLQDPAAGDLGLPDDSPLIDAGTPVPNIADRPGVDYFGAAPDLGARERR